MALQNAVQGDRHTGQLITWLSGNIPKVITGATITGKIYNPETKISVPISGVLSVVDGANGIFSWVYGVSDTSTVGNYTVQFTATYPDTLPDSSFEEGWTVLTKR